MSPEEQAHWQILKIMAANPDVTQRELAAELGVSLGKTNYLIKALLDKGVIKMQNFQRSDTKLKKIAYLLTPSGIRERVRLTRRYLKRVKTEYEVLTIELEVLERVSERSKAQNRAGHA